MIPRFVRLWTLVWVATICLHASFAWVARADDREVARAWFEQGVGHASRHEWPQAVEAFERSRELDERVPTLFNLMLAYDALQRPLEVARTVRLFLMRADPGRHQVERTRALELEAKAYASLARLSIQARPSAIEVIVDGSPPVFAADGKSVLLTPGEHKIQGRKEGYEPHQLAITVSAGERRVLDVSLKELSPRAALPEIPSVSAPVMAPSTAQVAPARESSADLPHFEPWRRPVARVFAIIGAASFIGSAAVLGAAYGRAGKLERRDSTEPGFLTASDDYQRMSRAVLPLSLVSAGVLATAAGVWPHKRRWLHWAAAGAGLVLVAAGVGLAASQPPAIEGTGLDQPRRQLGVFIAASGAPLLAFPFGKSPR